MSFLMLAQDIDKATETLSESNSQVDQAAIDIDNLITEHNNALAILNEKYEAKVAIAQSDKSKLQELYKTMHQLMAGNGFSTKEPINERLKPNEPSGAEMKAMALGAQAVRTGWKR